MEAVAFYEQKMLSIWLQKNHRWFQKQTKRSGHCTRIDQIRKKWKWELQHLEKLTKNLKIFWY